MRIASDLPTVSAVLQARRAQEQRMRTPRETRRLPPSHRSDRLLERVRDARRLLPTANRRIGRA